MHRDYLDYYAVHVNFSSICISLQDRALHFVLPISTVIGLSMGKEVYWITGID